MSYKDIISENTKISQVNWWPHYAYHYTDVSNAVSILESGMLYSRVRAKELAVMKNDNASRQVIDMTFSGSTSYVRFYFRPLTPTQFHNEGFKHVECRYDNDPNANVPVPVFLFFNLDRLLTEPNVCFSEGSEAGKGSPILKGEEAFASLDFKMIYNNGPISSQNEDEKKREKSLRHSEILYPDAYPIRNSLAGVFCRNSEEKMTLLNLLKDIDYSLFSFWLPHIRVINKDLFYNNGLYISETSLHDSDFSISFSDSYPRRKYSKNVIRDLNVKTLVVFEWNNENNQILYKREFECIINYFDARPLIFSEKPEIDGATELSVKVYIEEHLMSYKRYSLLNVVY